MVNLKFWALFILLWGGLATAAPMMSTAAILPNADTVSTRTTFDLHSESFFSPDYTTTDIKNFYFLGVHLNTEKPFNEESEQGLHYDVAAELAPQAVDISYINPRELYYRNGGLTLGRRLNDWSFIDEHWQLGLMQPQFRWNPLMPESQGLIGGFYDLGGPAEGWGLTFFGSPIFLPDQGPGYTVKNNQFVRSNPWFQYQPTSARIQGSDDTRTLLYDVEVPPLDRLILSPGGGASFFVGRSDGPATLRMSSAYMPASQMDLGLFFTAEPSDVAHVFVAPTVFYHSISSADLTLRSGQWEWRNGAMYEESQDPIHLKPEYTYVTYKPMVISSTSLAWSDRVNSVRLSGMWRQGGEALPIGPDTADMATLLPDRIPYHDAVDLTLATRPRWKAFRGLDLSGSYRQGITSNFRQWTWMSSLRVNRNWSVWGSLLFVSADENSPSLYRDLEDNDSVKVGVNYVF